MYADRRFLYGERSIVEVFWAENTENRAFSATSDKANAQNCGGHIYTLKSENRKNKNVSPQFRG